MRGTMRKQMKKVLYVALCGGLLWAQSTQASAATEAVYEYDVERGESNVYRGVVTTDDLNVRSKDKVKLVSTYILSLVLALPLELEGTKEEGHCDSFITL